LRRLTIGGQDAIPPHSAEEGLKMTFRISGLILLMLGVGVESPAQTYKALTDSGTYYSALIQGFSGYLYGTNSIEGQYGYGGSVFKMTPAGKVTTVYAFCAQPSCTDGEFPNTGIVLGTNGDIYGTTSSGGANSSILCNGETVEGCGTVFKLTPGGELTILYNFCSQTDCADGSGPEGALIQGFDGNFYGITGHGGTGACPNYDGFQPYGCGTIFKITPEGALTTLNSFCVPSCADGWDPIGNLIQARDGNFYGTTNYGGSGFGGPACDDACGTIFQVTPEGALTSLYSFCIQEGCPDGSHPQSGLVLANNGVFYGTASSGGAANDGTVFSFTTSNALTTLYSFCTQANCPDGNDPGGIILASDGNFYGYTSFGGVPPSGPDNAGTLFKITPAGALTTIYTFCTQTNCTDGSGPNASLFQYTNGTLYGSVGGGGPTGNGAIYSLSAGLHPFVTTLPTLGNVGRKVTILGNGLTDASAVTFHGTAAEFTVVSATEITTTVPGGATSGAVKVTVPGGTLSTDVAFLVP
jgi:uncharacterized repeat protein (TIGR03803 family)